MLYTCKTLQTLTSLQMVKVLATEQKKLIQQDKRDYYATVKTQGDILGPAQEWTTRIVYKWPLWKQAILVFGLLLLMVVIVLVGTNKK